MQRILESYNYLLNVPGKNIRGMLIDVFQLWLNIPQEKLDIIREIITSLHTSSLMYGFIVSHPLFYRIDDIEDNSKQRRGIPGMDDHFLSNLCIVAHEVFGIAATINAANYVYFLALQKVYIWYMNYS